MPSPDLREPATLLVVEHLTKKFGQAAVIDDLSLTLRPHERLVLLGPSGSGKSTLLRCIMGLEPIQHGVIRLEGAVCVEARGADTRIDRKVQRRIGMVFQHYTLFPHLTVMQNLLLAPVHVRGEARQAAAERGLELLRRFGLEDKSKEYPSRLSGGQKQRVAIARALMLEPGVMLFDEVTSALDPELVWEVLDMLIDLARQGMAMIVVTHEMDFARRIASRVLFIDHGRIVEEAPPEQFFASPREERTIRFLSRLTGARPVVALDD